MGLGAGLVGAIIWFAVRRLGNFELGLIAILVGFMVGVAVRKGSHGVGGMGYQILAVLITYVCIVANYLPDIIESALNNNPGGLSVLILADAFVYALQVPYLRGIQNIIGLLIIGFALWEAWKLNAYRPLPITGPYQLGTGPA
jgi:hypothetical protein